MPVIGRNFTKPKINPQSRNVLDAIRQPRRNGNTALMVITRVIYRALLCMITSGSIPNIRNLPMCARCCELILVCLSALSANAGVERKQPLASQATNISITTSRPDARKLFESGMVEFENEHTNKALENWQTAIRKDPSFAVAHLFISEATYDHVEQKAERRRAKALAGTVTSGEKLLIKWLTGVQEEQYVPAIGAMNDLLAKYPGDKRIAFLAGRWLSLQEQYEPAVKFLERAIALDAFYAPAWNRIAYCHAYSGDYSKAFAAMERYVTLLPSEPNPQNSYAEILRMSGNSRDALEHYRQALKIDPAFQSSQLGIADTYALMGEQATARTEYDKAIRSASIPGDKIRCALQSALTYIREKKPGKANIALNAVAKQAQDAHLSIPEAEALRILALYERETSVALKYLDTAEAALAADTGAPRIDLHDEQAQILRIRAIRAEAAGLKPVSDQALKQMKALVNTTHSATLRRSYYGALGSVLLTDHQYAEAIGYLQEDVSNPLSIQALILAYTQNGANDRAHVLELQLSAINQPTVEQALVVPELRMKLAATKEKRGWLQKFTSRIQ
jgi:tetratricopeptide (TPR) repeat protein